MTTIKPWTRGPFDLIVHAERHLRDAGDFDRRVAIVGFDNAIEVIITCYLTLKPVQRSGRSYLNKDVEQWLDNYHTKLDFLFMEAERLVCDLGCDKAELAWYHDVRNGQYHEGGATVPQMADLMGIRSAALRAFAFLFEVGEVEALVAARISEEANSDMPQRDEHYDALIDEAYGTVEIAGQIYGTSEALYGIDPVAYSELGGDLDQVAREDEERDTEPT